MDKPTVIFVLGLPGSGKTTVAAKLADIHGFPLVTTEVIGAQLLSVGQEDEDRDYSSEETQRIYNMMYLMTDLLLSSGSGVVVDGVFRNNEQRDRIFEIAGKYNATVKGYEVSCAEEVLLKRIRARKLKGTVSPAGEAGYRKIASEFEPVDDRFVRVDNSGPASDLNLQ
jgi:predicted kinase